MVYDININIFIFIFKMNDISDQTYKRVKYLRLLFINILIIKSALPVKRPTQIKLNINIS